MSGNVFLLLLVSDRALSALHILFPDPEFLNYTFREAAGVEMTYFFWNR